MSWDGIDIEERKMRDAKCTNAKSRANYSQSLCMKFDCPVRDVKCDECVDQHFWKEAMNA